MTWWTIEAGADDITGKLRLGTVRTEGVYVAVRHRSGACEDELHVRGTTSEQGKVSLLVSYEGKTVFDSSRERTAPTEARCWDVGKCRGCHAKIYWTKTARGKSVPLESNPRKVFDQSLGVFVNMHENHFAHCPKAGSFRKG